MTIIFVFCVALVMVIIAGLVVTTNITKRKIETVAILCGIVGIILLYLSYLMLEQALWGASMGFLSLFMAIMVLELSLKRRYKQINN